MKVFSSSLKRRTIAPLFCALAFAIFATISATAQTGIKNADRELQLWRTYSPTDVNFKISLPNEPTRQTTPTAFEDVVGIKYQSVTSSAMYQIIQINVPTNVESEELKTIFDDMVSAGIDEIDKKIGGVIVGKRKDVSIKNAVGREITVEKGTAISTLRIYLSGKKLFVVEVARPNFPNTPPALAKVYQAESDKFFNSFQISDNKKSENSTKGKKK